MALTPRQQEIVDLVARGMTNKAIARHVGISPETVKAHIRDAAARIPDDDVPHDLPQRRRLMLFRLSDPTDMAA